MSSIIEKALDRIADGPVEAPPAAVAPDTVTRQRGLDADKDFIAPVPDAAPVTPPPAQAGSRAPLGMRGIGAAQAEPAPGPMPLAPRIETPAPLSVPGEARTTTRYHEIDFERLAAKGCVTPDNLHSSVAEQIRLVKRPLLQSRPADVDDPSWHQNLIAITSSLPGEGKTFTTVNLAISLAMELDRTVLLVDGDVAKSDISRVLGYDGDIGLSDLMTDPSLDVADVMVRTNLPALNFIPAGKRRPNLTELFAAEQMVAMCDELATRYSDRIVLFDCAPLLAATGAQVLCELMGQVVFVVEAISTSRAAVRESLRLLTNARSVGVVLNKSRHNRTPGYRYGDYYYYYGGQ